MKPLMLMILDGYGLSDIPYGNASLMAKTPVLDELFAKYPHSKLEASGVKVGLPKMQMGNSEVGHTNIGAGRIIYQDLSKIDILIKNGDFFKNEKLLNAIKNCKVNNSNLHIMGLLSDGGVHSHINHLLSLLYLCKNYNFSNVYIHCFMDGRDTSPTSGKEYLKFLQSKIDEFGVGHIATVMGRYYAMDRDNRWDRIEKAYRSIVENKGIKYNNLDDLLENMYNDKTDEFLEPMILNNALLKEKDSVIFFNFRPDRARELTRSIVDSKFNQFKVNHFSTYFVCFTEYDKSLPNVDIAFVNNPIINTFSEYISSKGLKQLKIAETEKYAHVTFFFNGGIEQQYPLEDRILIPSPKVPTYDLKPEMSAYEVTERLLYAIKEKKYDVIILNYANPDMVGHTGNLEATIEALEHIDKCVKRVVDAILAVDGILMITADHGNCEKMLDINTQKPCTTHTNNLVPFAIINHDCELKDGILADIAPTMLDLLHLEKPKEMTGESLIK